METTLREVMTTEPIVLDASATAVHAARAMRARGVGDVLVRHEGELIGIVTDRDLVVRCIAAGENGPATTLGALCTRELTTLPPDALVDDAARLMQERAIRRIPVVENGRPVGIVSLGDVALARERGSPLAEISAAPPTR